MGAVCAHDFVLGDGYAGVAAAAKSLQLCPTL